MLDADTTTQLRGKWPDIYWDDWMREKVQRQNRTCIRPEISRSQTFGRIGVSKGQYYDKHLKFIVLNTVCYCPPSILFTLTISLQKPVRFTAMDLTYLEKVRHLNVLVGSLPFRISMTQSSSRRCTNPHKRCDSAGVLFIA